MTRSVIFLKPGYSVLNDSVISNVKRFSVMFYFHKLPRNVKKFFLF